MAITFRELSRTFNGGATSVSASSGDVQDGERIAAVLDADTGSGGFSAPAGWSQVIAPTGSGADVVAAYVKDALASSEPANYTFGLSSGSDGSVILYAINASSGTPEFDDADAAAATSGTSMVAPSVDAAEATAGLLSHYLLFSGTSAGRSISLPGTMTPILENVASNGWHLRSSASESVGLGATGTRTATASHTHTMVSANLVFSEVGGGGASITPDDTSHGHSAEQPAITQTHQLVPSDTSHAHSAESPSLMQTHELAPDNAAHAHVTTEPTVAQTHNISPNDASHAHTAGQPTISGAAPTGPDLNIVVSATRILERVSLDTTRVGTVSSAATRVGSVSVGDTRLGWNVDDTRTDRGD